MTVRVAQLLRTQLLRVCSEEAQRRKRQSCQALSGKAKYVIEELIETDKESYAEIREFMLACFGEVKSSQRYATELIGEFLACIKP